MLNYDEAVIGVQNSQHPANEIATDQFTDDLRREFENLTESLPENQKALVEHIRTLLNANAKKLAWLKGLLTIRRTRFNKEKHF